MYKADSLCYQKVTQYCKQLYLVKINFLNYKKIQRGKINAQLISEHLTGTTCKKKQLY